MKQIIPFIHDLIKTSFNKSHIAIDATAGNGNDTLFLASHLKHVYAFDIQEAAIKATTKRLSDANQSNVTLFHDSHEQIEKYVKTPYDVVMFNLGYLPKSDPSVITHKASTLNALRAALKGLNKGGLVCLTLYIGHAGGSEEADAVEAYVKALESAHYQVLKYQFVNKEKAPYNIIIKKK